MALTPDDMAKIRQMIHQENYRANVQRQYKVADIPRHTHNGIDSPFIYSSVVSYIGLINENGTPALLPSGWSSVLQGTNPDYYYSITHNLGLEYTGSVVTTGSIGTGANNTGPLYAVTVTSQDINFVFPLVNQYDNSFLVFLYESNSIPVKNAFSFNLTIINNKNSRVNNYYGSIVS